MPGHAQLPDIVGKRKECLAISNEKTKLWYLEFPLMRQSSAVSFYKVSRKIYGVISSNTKED